MDKLGGGFCFATKFFSFCIFLGGTRRHHRKITQPKSPFNQIASLFGVPDPTKTPILSTTSSSVLETLGSVFNFLSPAQVWTLTIFFCFLFVKNHEYAWRAN